MTSTDENCPVAEPVSDVECCEVAEPIRDVESLLQWDPELLSDSLKGCLARIPKLDLPCEESLRKPQTLLCHDMKGGYIEDRHLRGCGESDAYRLQHWAGVDWFVYFSHHLISVPPPGWVQAAHTNGVPVLGTLITEFDDGKILCSELFCSEERVNQVVEALVGIAKAYDLHGWLINIENELPLSQVAHLKTFCRYLTQQMKTIKQNSMVIWYDSVTTSGELKWQDQLNEVNCEWFSLCDAIFLNYCWDEPKLASSKQLANQMNLHNRDDDVRRVFVGVDVFGRNFYEGGGYNTHKAMEVIRKHGLSAAIFAHGWSHEVEQEGTDFLTRDRRLWAPLRPFLVFHGPSSLPLVTVFSDGRGNATYREGEVVSAAPWYDLSRTSLLPDLTVASLCDEVVYEEGSSLKLSNTSDEPLSIQLWPQCQLKAPDGGRLAIAAQVSAPPLCEASLSASCVGNSLEMRIVATPAAASSSTKWRKLECAVSVACEHVTSIVVVVGPNLPGLRLGKLEIRAKEDEGE